MTDELPILLAGPIVRRAERSGVHLWLATSVPLNGVTVHLFMLRPRRNAVAGRVPLPVRDDRETIQLGARLFVTLVHVRPQPQGSLPDQTLLGYDLRVQVDTGTSTEDYPLAELLENGLEEVSYPELGLPSFFIARDWADPLRFLHGSCRKPHGGGEDSLAAADEFLATLSRETPRLDDRPSVLLLTGDQIYADDVDKELGEHVSRLAVRLMGYEERIPGYAPPPAEYTRRDITPWELRAMDAARAARAIDPRDFADINLPEDRREPGRLLSFIRHAPPVELLEPRFRREASRFRTTTYPVSALPGTRRQFVHTHAGFTTEDQNHLLTFGEYAAMYVTAWSTATWPPKVLGDSVEAFRRGTTRVRRLLANVATYMFFDDHEVTDDWNIDGRWNRIVSGSVAGRRIIANGLAAYWAFQAWGNVPARFSDAFKDSIGDYLRSAIEQDGAVADEDGARFEAALWDFRDWSFGAPTTPVTVFADTRTERDFVPARRYEDQKLRAAGLMTDAALKRLAEVAQKAGHRPGEPLILVSPAPVYGYGPAEYVQEELLVPASQLTTKAGKEGGRYAWDLESWRANRFRFVRFVTFVAEVLNPSYCVFLSGDVHYAFSQFVTFVQVRRHWIAPADQELPQPIRLPVVQLTASSLKNASDKTRDLIAKRLTRHFDFPADLPVVRRVDHPSPVDPAKLIAIELIKTLPTTGFGPSPVTGETNVGRVEIHGPGTANPRIRQILFVQLKDRIRSNEAEIRIPLPSRSRSRG